MDLKPQDRFSVEELGYDGKSDELQKGNTFVDSKDMDRMGKKQELRVSRTCAVDSSMLIDPNQQRNFKFLGIVGFVTILQSTWEGTLLANYYGLLNGGTAGVIWATVAVWVLMLALIASMAEMVVTSSLQ